MPQAYGISESAQSVLNDRSCLDLSPFRHLLEVLSVRDWTFPLPVNPGLFEKVYGEDGRKRFCQNVAEAIQAVLKAGNAKKVEALNESIAAVMTFLCEEDSLPDLVQRAAHRRERHGHGSLTDA